MRWSTARPNNADPRRPGPRAHADRRVDVASLARHNKSTKTTKSWITSTSSVVAGGVGVAVGVAKDEDAMMDRVESVVRQSCLAAFLTRELRGCAFMDMVAGAAPLILNYTQHFICFILSFALKSSYCSRVYNLRAAG